MIISEDIGLDSDESRKVEGLSIPRNLLKVVEEEVMRCLFSRESIES